MARLGSALAALALALGPPTARAGSHAFLPGVAPSAFMPEDKVALQANKVNSVRTQLPYEYNDLPFCKVKHSRAQTDNIGEVLAGDKMREAPYDIRVLQNTDCKFLCQIHMDKKTMAQLRHLIDEEYRVHWLLDNLPVAVFNDGYVTRGYPVGFVAPASLSTIAGKHFLYNHVKIIVRYNAKPERFEGVRIVGFEVVPYSVRHDYEGSIVDENTKFTTCPVEYDPNSISFQSVEEAYNVIFTYDVRWEQSETGWSQRWDVYLQGSPDDEIHYFSIINSLMIVLFLTGVVAMIMLRTLRKDISTYNEMQTLEEAQEESGWKLVHGDVFRPPTFSPMLLSVLAGSGVQVLAMTFSTMVFALFGLLSPANRGSLLTALLMLFVMFGFLAGYYSARLYKLFHGKKWKQNTLLTAMALPGVIFSIFFAVDALLHHAGSSTAVPYTTVLMLLVLWLGVSMPLVLVGSYFGFKKTTIEVPVRTNQIARHIPDQVWYTHAAFAIALGGVLPFGAVCIELFFIMSAMWLQQLYFIFGFLFSVLIILCITCAEISIVMIYFQLCNEDYRWWWRSFLCSGSSALYLFGYAIWYYCSKLEIDGAVSTFVYFAYMLIVSLLFFVLTGSIGFWSCLWFVRQIFQSIKVD